MIILCYTKRVEVSDSRPKFLALLNKLYMKKKRTWKRGSTTIKGVIAPKKKVKSELGKKARLPT
jgi:hypothetical protein